VFLLAVSVVLLAVVGDLHVHVDHHEGSCLDSPRGSDSRLHSHGPCAVCQSTRQVVAEMGWVLSAAATLPLEEVAPRSSGPPVAVCRDLSTPPRAPPVLL